MSELSDESVQCVVTSPPYWGLRKYAGEQELMWGGDKQCAHKWTDSSIPQSGGVSDYEVGRIGNAAARIASHESKESSVCSLCGAWRGQFGLESTIELYVQHTVEILREIRRVLRKDGVVFWNIGDSYAGGGNYRVINSENTLSTKQASNRGARGVPQELGAQGKNTGSVKPKDLCLIPFRVALAAQSDGWWVRSVIIWNKPNPMPESVTDRPTESHEYILMLTKSAHYYWDQVAGSERASTPLECKSSQTFGAKGGKAEQVYGEKHLVSGKKWVNNGTHNLRSVWAFPTQPYKGAHFATFPEKLPERCIKAATPEYGCCAKCGKPWERIVERIFVGSYHSHSADGIEYGLRQHDGGPKTTYKLPKTLGWRPTCKCNADRVPSLVLDPFLGSGTTLYVAKKLGRRGVGYELSTQYCKLALERNRQMGLI